MPQQVKVSIDSNGRIVLTAVGGSFELVTDSNPPPPPPPPPPDPDPGTGTPPPTSGDRGYIWADVATFPNKPRTGRGWTEMYNFAKGNAPGPVSVEEQNSGNIAWVHACGNVYAATGDMVFYNKDMGAVKALV